MTVYHNSRNKMTVELANSENWKNYDFHLFSHSLRQHRDLSATYSVAIYLHATSETIATNFLILVCSPTNLPVATRSAIVLNLVGDRSATNRRLIGDWSATDRRLVGDCSIII